MNPKDFETENERLGQTLRQVAPEFNWYGECSHLFDGYQYVWRGVGPGRYFFSSSRVAKSFYTYSWSWDGSIDEAYLAQKIRAGKSETYLLSDNLQPHRRTREEKAWALTGDEPPPPNPFLDWLMLPIGMVAGLVFIWSALVAVMIMPIWYAVRGVWRKIRQGHP